MHRHFLLLFFFFPLAIEAATFLLPKEGALIGKVVTVYAQPGDNLADLAKSYDLGYDEMVIANPDIDPWFPPVGSQIILPLQFILPPSIREGIVINIPEMRLYYYPKGENTVITFPIGIGREGWSTPIGVTKITKKTPRPSWTPPASIRAEHAADGDPLPPVVAPGPDNPLGPYALRLGFPSYLLHGSNKPYGIGMRVSHGCIRLYNDDIEKLFSIVPEGTRVETVNAPFKMTLIKDSLYFESHPPLPDHNQEAPKAIFQTVLMKEADHLPVAIEWDKAYRLLEKPDGLPHVIGQLKDSAPALLTRNLPPPFPENKATPPKAPSQLSKNKVYLQAGAFSERKNVDLVTTQLKMLGVESVVIEPKGVGRFYRVLVGPFQDEEKSSLAKARLEKIGIKTFVVNTR
jgi:L,D-transpeptidase ErfK/SrfK